MEINPTGTFDLKAEATAILTDCSLTKKQVEDRIKLLLLRFRTDHPEWTFDQLCSNWNNTLAEVAKESLGAGEPRH